MIIFIDQLVLLLLITITGKSENREPIERISILLPISWCGWRWWPTGGSTA